MHWVLLRRPAAVAAAWVAIDDRLVDGELRVADHPSFRPWHTHLSNHHLATLPSVSTAARWVNTVG